MSELHHPLELPCGVVLKNRLVKSPMSDSLGDGEGNPSEAQMRLYERWAEGGVALSLIGEVQIDPHYPEKPGNLVFEAQTDQSAIQALAQRATIDGAHLWAQLGHAGALAHQPISQAKGPSPLDVEGLQCGGLSLDELHELPGMYAKAALIAKNAGFSGVQIHAGHGFLLSQFLSPLFNLRTDNYGGSVANRSLLIIEVINEVRSVVGAEFPIGVRINSTDQLDGGLIEDDALEAVRLIGQTSVDLIDISGGTYFPGAKASSDSSSSGAYFVEFAKRAKEVTDVPVMATGGFKTRGQAVDAVASGAVDMVGIARAMVLNPELPNDWLAGDEGNSSFPRFESTPPGGVTAWYTMRITALGEDQESEFKLDLPSAIEVYEERDAQRCVKWQAKFFDHS